MTLAYVILSTFCWTAYPTCAGGFTQEHCYQQARVSTSSVTMDGETAYLLISLDVESGEQIRKPRLHGMDNYLFHPLDGCKCRNKQEIFLHPIYVSTQAVLQDFKKSYKEPEDEDLNEFRGRMQP